MFHLSALHTYLPLSFVLGSCNSFFRPLGEKNTLYSTPSHYISKLTPTASAPPILVRASHRDVTLAPETIILPPSMSVVIA
ncbi:hypothetical protein LX36DRAFT_657830 [Colletotrichum falcatum]|nr:hypothetical protein LX36DRAFT_657830 [Colletotrichum falcatum]